MKKEFRVTEELDFGKRIDSFLKEHFSDFSRSFLQEQIKKGKVLLNGKNTENDYRLQAGDLIESDFDLTRQVIEKSDIPVEIIYEDDYLICVNKPAGMVVHPACGNYSDTLVNVLMARYGIDEMCLNSGESSRLGIVHRLDKETSGVLLVAKNEAGKNLLQAQFADRTIKKEYRTIAEGVVIENTGRISAPIKRDDKNRLKMIPDSRGKQAETLFEVKERFKRYTYLAVFPKTGRTHQIRTHLAYVKHPVAGDITYGGKKDEALGIKRTLLHAFRITFVNPATKKIMELSAPLPEDFCDTLEKLRIK